MKYIVQKLYNKKQFNKNKICKKSFNKKNI